MASKWSDRLIEETRTAIRDLAVTPQGVLYMKNVRGGYGKISFEDLSSDNLKIKDAKSEAEYFYTSTDELISAGWAID